MLSAHEVSFSYHRWRPVRVLEDLSWVVAPGATTLLLGPNGAGKSTLLKLLAGQERPTRGEVRFNGETSTRSLYAGVSWMPQQATAMPGFTVLEQLEFAGWISGIDSREASRRAGQALEMVALTSRSGVRSSRLSGGQLRRLALGQAWVRGGEILLLDEPTAGLDPAQTRRFTELLAGFDYPGGIVISTHQVADLEGDIDRITVLDEGSIRFDDTVAAFADHGRSHGIESGSTADIFTAIIRDPEQ